LRDYSNGSITLKQELLNRANQNELRYLFFQVTEGYKQIEDKDGLIRGYADCIKEINPGQFINIFFIDKRLDREYLPIFVKKISDHSLIIFDKLQEHFNLGRINPDELKQCYQSLASYGQYRIASRAMKKMIELDGVDDESLEQTSDQYIDNIVKDISRMDGGTVPVDTSTIYNSLIVIIGHNQFSQIKPYFLRQLFEQSATSEPANKFILTLYESSMFDEYIETAFPQDDDRQLFFEKLLQTNSYDLRSRIIKNLTEADVSFPDTDDLIVKTIQANNNTRQKFIDHSLTLDNIGLLTHLLKGCSSLTNEEKDKLIDYIEKRGSDRYPIY